MENMKDIKLAELFSALLRKLWLVVLCAVILGALSYAYTSNFITPMYRSSITIYVNNKNATTENNTGIVTGISGNDLATSQRLVDTYIQILKSDRVLEPVAASVGGGYEAKHVRSLMSAAALNETEVFEVWISHSNPEMAAKIANAIAEVAPKEIADILEGSSTKIIDHAKPAAAPYSPNVTRNTTFGMAGGAILAACFVILQTMLDVRVKSEEDLALISKAPVLGLIPDLAVDNKDSYGYTGYRYGYKSRKKSGSEEADV